MANARKNAAHVEKHTQYTGWYNGITSILYASNWQMSYINGADIDLHIYGIMFNEEYQLQVFDNSLFIEIATFSS
jgi:hypothetical protein